MFSKAFSKINIKDLVLCIVGAVIYALAINVFVTPLNLYASGFVGIAQLLEIPFKNIPALSNININGIIYLVLNIPLFIIGFKVLGKSMILKSLFVIVLDSILLTIIPIPSEPLIEDVLTACIVGGTIEGIGCVMTFLGFGSSGGVDTLGLILTKKSKGLSVGRVALFVNLCIYTICTILFSFEIAVYSFLLSLIESYIIDKFHAQNNSVSVNIITNSKQEEIKDYIVDTLNRDATILQGVGGYSQKDKYVIVSIMSEYELNELKRDILNIDKNAFIYITSRVSIIGNFEKRLSRE